MKNSFLISLFAIPAGLTCMIGCASPPEDDLDIETSDDELAAELTAGKADGATDVIVASAGRIELVDAPARQLYDLMTTDGASATTVGGYRVLRKKRISCITDGIGTYCEVRGSTDSEDEPGFAAGIHGNSTTSAASYLLRLLQAKAGSTANVVSIPWFRCVKQGGVWCGVEEPRELALSFDKLPPVGDDFVYEGWSILDGATTTGRFAGTSALTQYIPASRAEATAYVLTVEPRRGDDPRASKTHILAASLADGEGALSTEHAAAIGTDFADAEASYILATPTTAATNDNDLGIWFVIPGGPEALVLPTLPDGWIYEGWVVNDTGPVTTGRFRAGPGADSDGAGPTAGPLAGPPRPGQDFISPPRSLIGGRVAITVEPEPDTSTAPFPIRPLLDMAVENVAVPATQMLANTHEERPSGSVSLQ